MMTHMDNVIFYKNQAVLTIPKTTISNKAILYCINQNRHSFSISIKDADLENFQIILNFQEENTDIEVSAYNFLTALIDQQVRLDLENRFGNIRDRIIEAAFAPINKSTNNV